MCMHFLLPYFLPLFLQKGFIITNGMILKRDEREKKRKMEKKRTKAYSTHGMGHRLPVS